mmetsp:Transcript_34855/g.84811  ORF Transcript_34855/g.84811 Transcript_34855/m.84811 type:complete len:514 (-) Transcript_34855:91-1632(-)
MNGAAIAAGLKNAKHRKKTTAEARLEAYNNLPTHEALRRIEKVTDVIHDLSQEKLFGISSGDVTGLQTDDATTEKQIEGLISMVEEKIDRSSSYRKLLGTCFFFVVYICTLFLQREVRNSFEIEDSLLNALASSLPTLGSGGYFNSGAGATGELSKSDDFYTWIDGIAGNIYSDPVCGDGVCDAGEYAGFGRFGCIPDCGRYNNVTTITINLEDYVLSHPGGWDLTAQPDIQDMANPQFRYNIWSFTMGDYLFATDLANETATVEVPDGELQLELYQTARVAGLVEDSLLTSQYDVTTNSIPAAKDGISDYFYGDPLEFLKAGAALNNAITRYCWNTATGAADARCLTMSSADLMFYSLGAYGLAGSVSMTVGRKDVRLATVGFCGAFKNASHGATDANRQEWDVARIDCPTVRRASEAPPRAPKKTSPPKVAKKAPERLPGAWGKLGISRQIAESACNSPSLAETNSLLSPFDLTTNQVPHPTVHPTPYTLNPHHKTLNPKNLKTQNLDPEP